MRFKNQKEINCHNDSAQRAKTLNGGWHIMINDWDSQAMKILNPSAYLLYRYLCKNMDGYTFDLSPVAVKNYTGMGKSSYENAVKELIEKRFLISNPTRKDAYDFYLVGGGNTSIKLT